MTALDHRSFIGRIWTGIGSRLAAVLIGSLPRALVVVGEKFSKRHLFGGFILSYDNSPKEVPFHLISQIIGHAQLLFFYSAPCASSRFRRISKTSASPLSRTAKEEQFYLQKLKEGDLEARNILVEHNLRLVA